MKNAFDRSVLIKMWIIVTVLVTGLFALSGTFGIDYGVNAASSGPSPSHTNGPGEDNCTACHTSFPLNSGSGSVTISGVPPNYLPLQNIQMTVTTADPGPSAAIFGFQLTALDRLGQRAGTFSVPVQTPQKTQIVSGFVGGNQRQYVEHTIDGLFTAGVFGHNTWTFTWTAPAARIGKIDFYAAGNGANGDGTNGGDYIYASKVASFTGTAVANFDSDGSSDISVFRPSNGAWYSLNSTDGQFVAGQFGQQGDVIAPGDYDGDGITDQAVFRPSNGTWYANLSSGGFMGRAFGLAGDIPVQGDYDGDLKTDLAVFRPSEGVWYLYQSSAGFSAVSFGSAADRPVVGDFDGDGKADLTVFRPSNGIWYSLQSSKGFQAVQFGISEDKTVAADYDGDGRTDYAVFRPSNGTWYLLESSDGFRGQRFGVGTDTPSPADFDGDGKTDIAVYRAQEGAWFGLRSSDGSVISTTFGISGDIPVPTGYLAR